MKGGGNLKGSISTQTRQIRTNQPLSAMTQAGGSGSVEEKGQLCLDSALSGGKQFKH